MKSLRVFEKLQAGLLTMSTSNSPFSSASVYLVAIVGQYVTQELRKMKRVIPQVAMLFVLAFSSAGLVAQMPESQAPMDGGQMGHGPRQPMSADQRLQMLTKQLNLNSDQQQQIKPILENESQQMQTLRQDTTLAQPDKMSKMRSIHDSTASQIKPILNPEQQAKFEQMMSRHEHRGAMGPGPDGSMAPPPGQGAPPQQL